MLCEWFDNVLSRYFLAKEYQRLISIKSNIFIIFTFHNFENEGCTIDSIPKQNLI